MKSILQTITIIGGLTAPLGAYAENITLNFYALGIRAGTITVNGTETKSSYSVKGTVTPTRLLKAFKDVGYSGSASGKRKGKHYYSKKYLGNARTGSRNSTVKMHWSGNKPVVDKYTPVREKRDYDINPSQQVGTKDLLTSGYATFKSAPIEELCNTVHKMFDGRRRTQITLGKPKISGNIATCQGTYKRIAGFSPNAMQKKVNFPFTIKYEHQNDETYRFKEFTSAATIGNIRATRK